MIDVICIKCGEEVMFPQPVPNFVCGKCYKKEVAKDGPI